MKESRQPKAGDIWLCNEGAVLVFGVSGNWVEYLWQETPNRFESESCLIKDWHKHFEYKENIFDCEELKDKMPQDYQEIKAQQRVFEAMASGQTTQKIHDLVNHPSHYTSDPSGIECIEIAQNLPFCLGNCYKYLHRAWLKGNTKQDLKKARWYAERGVFNNQKLNTDDIQRIKYVASKQTNKTLGALLTWFANCTDDHARYMVFIRCLDKVIESLGADIE